MKQFKGFSSKKSLFVAAFVCAALVLVGYFTFAATPAKPDYIVAARGKSNHGSVVREAQSDLNICCNYKLAVDGAFGPKTEAAIKKYQNLRKLKKRDGKLWSSTLSSLRNESKVKNYNKSAAANNTISGTTKISADFSGFPTSYINSNKTISVYKGGTKIGSKTSSGSRLVTNVIAKSGLKAGNYTIKVTPNVFYTPGKKCTVTNSGSTFWLQSSRVFDFNYSCQRSSAF